MQNHPAALISTFEFIAATIGSAILFGIRAIYLPPEKYILLEWEDIFVNSARIVIIYFNLTLDFLSVL